MIPLDKQFAKQLKRLSGPELVTELNNIINSMSEEPGSFLVQRARDRGSYLILENIRRVPDDQKGEVLMRMLEANPQPSRGVQAAFEGVTYSLDKSTQLPPAVIAAMAIGIGTHPTINYLKRTGGLSFETFLEIEKIFVDRDKPEMLARLADVFFPNLVAAFTFQMIVKADKEMTAVLDRIDGGKSQFGDDYEIEKIEKYAAHAAELAVKHEANITLARLKESNLLDQGDKLYWPTLAQAALLLDDVEWGEVAIKQVIDVMRKGWCEDEPAVYAAARMTLKPELQKYVPTLWTAIQVNGAEKYRSDTITRLRVMARYAIDLRDEKKQTWVTNRARQLLSSAVGYSSYGILEMLAPFNALAKTEVEGTPRPEWRLILWA